MPVYNEIARLGPTLGSIVRYLKGQTFTSEILICDDGSTDGTTDQLERWAGPVPLRVLRGPHRGKGAAVRRGVEGAQGRLILITDADLSTPIEEVATLQVAIDEGFDIAIGSRAMPDSRIAAGRPAARRAMSQVYRSMTRLAGLPAVRDPQCGFKLFRAEAAKDVFARSSIRGFAFDTETLMLAAERGYRVAELGVSWEHHDGSKVAPMRDAARMTRDIALSRLRLKDAAIDSDEAARSAWQGRRQVLRALIFLNVFGLLWWADWLIQFQHAASPVLYGLLLVAQGVNLFQALGFWHLAWNIRAPERDRAAHRPPGSVAVWITAYDEPVEIIERTLLAALAVRGPHRTLLLDDGRREELQALCQRLGAEWVTRPDNAGAKAGNLNHALKTAPPTVYIAFFDADHAPHPDFLERLLPFFRDPRMAWVQAPQTYVNREDSYVAGAAMDQQAIFFGPICEGQDGKNAVLCCGTNFVMRRAALLEVGGFPVDTVTEDAMAGLELHRRGWRSRYVAEHLADGLGPEDLGAYVSQQRRWATGNFQLLGRVAGAALRGELRPRLAFQYAWGAANYLSWVPTLVYLTLPALFLGFGIQTVKTSDSGNFLIHFLPFITLTLAIFIRSMDGRLRVRGIQMSFGMFPVQVEAFAAAVTRRRVRFQVTRKTRSTQNFYRLVVPQAVAAAVIVITTVSGLLHYQGPSTITNVSWSFFNLMMLAGVLRASRPEHASEAGAVAPVREAA